MEQNIEHNEGPFSTQPAQQSGNIGPLAAAVVIVLLLAAAGFYFFYSQQQKQQAQDAAQARQATEAQGQGAVASNDSTGAIQSDLNATQTSGTDTDVSSLNNAL